MIDLIKHFPQLLDHCKVIDKGILVFTLRTVGYKQTQLIIIPPGVFVPDHSHPDVANEIQPLYGWAEIRKSGRSLKIDGFQHPRSYYINKDEVHGITTFDTPFVYISTQYWQVEPRSIETNWIGPALSTIPTNITHQDHAPRKRLKLSRDTKASF